MPFLQQTAFYGGPALCLAALALLLFQPLRSARRLMTAAVISGVLCLPLFTEGIAGREMLLLLLLDILLRPLTSVAGVWTALACLSRCRRRFRFFNGLRTAGGAGAGAGARSDTVRDRRRDFEFEYGFGFGPGTAAAAVLLLAGSVWNAGSAFYLLSHPGFAGAGC